MGRFADLLLEQPETTEPIPATSATRFSDLVQTLNRRERRFYEKIQESYRRGDLAVLNDIAAYEAMIEGQGGEEAISAVIDTRRKLQQKERIDPIQSNLLTNLVYGSAKILPGIWRGTKAGGKGAAIGAGVGALGGAAVGLLVPSVGEEPVTVIGGAAIGAKAMAKLGFAEGGALFWYKQGVGEMYLNMLEKEYDPQTSKTVAQIAGIPYALIELVQVKQLAPGIRKGAQQVLQKTMLGLLGRAAKRYGATLTKEVLEEVAQEFVEIGAEDLSAYLSGKGIPVDKDYLKERTDRLYRTGKGALQAMALLPIPGAAIEAEMAAITPEPLTVDVMGQNVEKYGIKQLQSKYKKWLKSPEGIAEKKALGLPKGHKFEQPALWETFNRQLLSEDLAKAPAEPTATASFNKWQDDFILYSRKVREAEKTPGRKLTLEEIALQEKDWKEFSRKRGYTEQEIQDYEKEQELAREGVEKFGLTPEHLVLIEKKGKIKLPTEKAITTRAGIYQPSERVAPIIGDLNRILGKAQVELKKQKVIRKGELADKFSRAHDALESGEGEQAFYNALGQLRGELTKLGIAPPLTEGFTEEAYFNLVNDIKTSDRLSDTQKIELFKALQVLIKEGKIPRDFEIVLFEKQFGSEMAEKLLRLRPIGEQRWKEFLDIINIPKASATALDISRGLRQDVLIAIGSPGIFAKSLAAQYKLFRSEDFARQIEKEMLTDEYADLRKKSGVIYRERGVTAGWAQRQEQFATKYAQRIPGISHSERAFTDGGNYTRTLFFNKWADYWKKTGFAATMKDYKNLAHIANILTGEGDVSWLGKHADFFNALFFSPRFFSSRIQTLIALFDPRIGWETRKILAYHVGTFAITGLTVLGLASLLPGVDIERNPRSTDWGKIRIGNQRIDFWAGYGPLARTVYQLITGERKTRAGQIVTQDRFDTIVRFLQSKLSPAAGFALDVGRGETFYGEDMALTAENMTQQVWGRFVPFVIQDIVDAIAYQGLGAGMLAAPLAWHGIGVQTYPLSRGAEIKFKKDEIASEVFGKQWDDLGVETQKVLREEFPIIEDLERKASKERDDYDFVSRITKEQQEIGDEIFNKLPSTTKIELDELKVSIGGLSRRISSDWLLNDKRYQEYQDQTFQTLNKVLPYIIKLKNWSQLSTDEKRLILDEVITKTKEAIRKSIVDKANIEDFERLGIKTR